MRVSDSVAPAAFDDLPWAHPGDSLLTEVLQPAYQRGITAGAKLIERMCETGSPEHQEIVLGHE
jgi:DNA-binding LacI/PurR family transcriptional regulator